MDKTARSLNEIINDFNQEIKSSPAADSYLTRGILKYCLKDLNGAFGDWETAVGLGCKNTILLLKFLTVM